MFLLIVIDEPLRRSKRSTANKYGSTSSTSSVATKTIKKTSPKKNGNRTKVIKVIQKIEQGTKDLKMKNRANILVEQCTSIKQQITAIKKSVDVSVIVI